MQKWIPSLLECILPGPQAGSDGAQEGGAARERTSSASTEAGPAREREARPSARMSSARADERERRDRRSQSRRPLGAATAGGGF